MTPYVPFAWQMKLREAADPKARAAMLREIALDMGAIRPGQQATEHEIMHAIRARTTPRGQAKG